MNFSDLAKRLEIEEEEYIELLKLFVDIGFSDITELQTALETGDNDKAANAAHSLKGAAGSLGLTEFYETAKKVEMDARQMRMAGIAKDILLLKSNLESIISAL